MQLVLQRTESSFGAGTTTCHHKRCVHILPNNASGGTPLFTTILNVQTTAVTATNNGANVPNSALYSVSTSAVVADAVVSGGNAVPNGTLIYCLIIGV